MKRRIVGFFTFAALAAGVAVALYFAGQVSDGTTTAQEEAEKPTATPASVMMTQPPELLTGVDAGLPTPLQVEVREPTEAIVVYSVPPADSANPIQDGTVFARVVDPRSGAALGEDWLVGSFTEVKPVHSNSPDASPAPRIMAASVLRDPPLDEFTLGREGVSLVRSVRSTEASDRELAGPSFVEAVAAPDGMSYRATDKSIIGTDGSGAVVATYALPRALPITGPEQFWVDGNPEPGQYDLDALDAAASLLISGEGHLLVFVANIVNSALVDLSTDRRLDLPGYGYVAAAAVGQDGYVYAVLIDGRSRANPYVLAQIDAKSMELKQLAETTVRPSEWRGPIFISLVATPSGDIFFYATLWDQVQDPDVYAHTNVLLHLDRATFQLAAIAVPADLGQRVTVGVDGKIYIYGGPAESTVSAYDPSTGELSRDLPALRTPPGTYIRALFVR
jgi:hypothetical protein